MRKYAIELTSSAEKAYRRIFEAARLHIEEGGIADANVALLEAVDELIDRTIPSTPFERAKSLSHPLSGVYWVSKERLRVFYAASTKPNTIVILSISNAPRKEADLRHADAVLRQMILSGQLDHLLVQLGPRSLSPNMRVRPSVIN